MFPLDNDSWKALRRFMVTTDALNLRTGSFSLGDVITESFVTGKIGWLISRGAIQETDYDLSQLDESPRENGRS